MRRWLVTGGAGFIGSHFMDLVRAKEPDALIWCIDKLTYAAEIDHTASADTLNVGDICDSTVVNNTVRLLKPDVAVNFAAESHVDNSYRQTPSFTRSNVDGVVSLLEAIRGSSTFFVQISTDEVYGDTPKDHNVYDALHPQNPYAATKAAAEFMVNSYVRSFGTRAMITRSSNNWGPRQHVEKFIPTVLRAKESGEPVTLHGEELRRDWLHVEDNVRAIYELTCRQIDHVQDYSVWNVATGTQHTLEDILNLVGGVSYNRSPERPGVDRGYWVDSASTWNVLGWSPVGIMDDKERWKSYVESSPIRHKAVR